MSVGPVQPVQPIQPVAATPAVPSWFIGCALFTMLFVIALGCAAAVGGYYLLHGGGNSPAPAPVVAVDPQGVKDGSAYRPLQDAAYADAADGLAASIEAGKAIGDSQAVFQSAFESGRQSGFASTIQPSLAKILPEGSEPTTTTQRAAFAAYWRGVARGFRGQTK